VAHDQAAFLGAAAAVAVHQLVDEHGAVAFRVGAPGSGPHQLLGGRQTEHVTEITHDYHRM
jgi:hypothetical protein